PIAARRVPPVETSGGSHAARGQHVVRARDGAADLFGRCWRTRSSRAFTREYSITSRCSRSSASMRDHARVVIIGGGIAGCSIAYHLARKGWTDVVLVDKGELTSGTTWHAAGMVTHFHTSPTLMRMRKYSIELYRQLQAEPGAARHWHEVGSLRVASSRDQMRFLQRQVGMARAIGLEVETISPAESLRIFPLMSVESLH